MRKIPVKDDNISKMDEIIQDNSRNNQGIQRLYRWFKRWKDDITEESDQTGIKGEKGVVLEVSIASVSLVEVKKGIPADKTTKEIWWKGKLGVFFGGKHEISGVVMVFDGVVENEGKKPGEETDEGGY